MEGNDPQMQISVILCTHNPRMDYLQRVLAALARQTLPATTWEVVLVDNASHPPIPTACLNGFSNFRLIHEGTLGKPNALMAGIAASTGELLVTVDDDNILEPDYLAQLLVLHRENPQVGVFGASIKAEYEAPPPPFIEFYASYLAIRDLTQDIVGDATTPHSSPIGAGMGLLRSVAESYVIRAQSNLGLLAFGRKGTSLQSAADDTLFGYLAQSLGYKCGAFRALRLTHLIPQRRLTEEYLQALAEGVTRSHLYLAYVRGAQQPSRYRFLRWQAGNLIWRLHPDVHLSRFCRAILRGRIKANRDFKRQPTDQSRSRE